MAHKATEEQETQILAAIEKGTPYSIIAEQFGVGKGTISRIKARAKSGDIKKMKTPKHTIATRNKIRETQIQKHLVRKSEIIVGTMVDILQSIQYSVDNLLDINEDAQTKVDEIESGLTDLLDKVDKHIHNIDLNEKGKDVGKQELVRHIHLTLNSVAQYYSKQKIRIEAIKALEGQMKLLLDSEVTMRLLKATRQLLADIARGLNVLDDNNYMKVKERIIELNEGAGDFFAAHETVETSPEHNNE